LLLGVSIDWLGRLPGLGASSSPVHVPAGAASGGLACRNGGGPNWVGRADRRTAGPSLEVMTSVFSARRTRSHASYVTAIDEKKSVECADLAQLVAACREARHEVLVEGRETVLNLSDAPMESDAGGHNARCPKDRGAHQSREQNVLGALRWLSLPMVAWISTPESRTALHRLRSPAARPSRVLLLPY